MDNKSSKTKILVIMACCMLAVVVALVIVIVCLNKKDESRPVGEEVVSATTTTPTVNAEIDPMKKNENEISEVSNDKEENTSTPTEIVESDPITITVGEYQGIKVDYSPKIITDADIDKQLAELRREYTEIIDMPDRSFENGDMAIITYKGKVEGELIPELYAVCLQVILGRGYLPDVFEDEILKRKKGENFSLSIDYPDDFSEIPEIAGKTVVFDVELVDGFIFYTPEIDDEFIKTSTGYSTVEEYRNTLKENLQKKQDDLAYETAISDLKNKVIENTTFTGPIDSEIKKQYVIKINELNNQYQEDYMLDAATYYYIYYGIPTEQYTASVMEDVTREVKYNYILQKIASEKGISVEEADKLIVDSAIFEGLNR